MKQENVLLTAEVIAAVNEELAYQSALQPMGRADDNDHGVSGQLVTLVDYTNKAVTAWTQSAGEEEALHALRKVAGIACRALIKYGCPRREGADHES